MSSRVSPSNSSYRSTPSRADIAQDVVGKLLGSERRVLMTGESGSGRTYLLGLVYDSLRADDDMYWPERDESWANFPVVVHLPPRANTDWLWFGVTCTRAAELPAPSVIQIAEQIDVHARRLTTFHEDWWRDLRSGAKGAAGDVFTDMVPLGSILLQVGKILREVTNSAGKAFSKRSRHVALTTVDERRVDLVNTAWDALRELAKRRRVVLAVDNVHHADAPLLELLGRASAAEDSDLVVVLTADAGSRPHPLCEPFARVNVGPLSQDDIRGIVIGVNDRVRPDVADAIGEHVDRHALDLAELLPVIATDPPATRADVRRLPRRRRVSAELTWSRLCAKARLTLGAVAWLSDLAGKGISPALVLAVVPKADLSAAADSGWIPHGAIELRISDPLHAEIAIASLASGQTATFAQHVLDHYAEPCMPTIDDLPLLTGAARTWMLANPGPVTNDRDQERLRRAGDAAIELVQLRIALGDGRGALQCYDVAERIARELDFTSGELAVLTSLRARALVEADRMESAVETVRRAAAAPGISEDQRRRLTLNAQVVGAQLDPEAPRAVNQLLDTLGAQHESGLPNGSPDELMIRLAVARQQSRAGDPSAAALTYLSVARDLEADAGTAQRFANEGGSDAAAAHANAGRVLRASEPDRAGNELERAAGSVDADDSRALSYWSQTRLQRMLTLVGGTNDDRVAAFERGLQGPALDGTLDDPPLQSTLRLYPDTVNHRDQLAIGLGHAGAMLLLDRPADVALLLDDIERHLNTQGLERSDHLRQQLAFDRIHLALLEDPDRAPKLLLRQITDDPVIAGEFLWQLMDHFRAADLQREILKAVNATRENAAKSGDGQTELSVALALVQFLVLIGQHSDAAQISALYLEAGLSPQQVAIFVWACALGAWKEGARPDLRGLENLLSSLPPGDPLHSKIQEALTQMNGPNE